jgi:hypothetical protein
MKVVMLGAGRFGANWTLQRRANDRQTEPPQPNAYGYLSALFATLLLFATPSSLAQDTPIESAPGEPEQTFSGENVRVSVEDMPLRPRCGLCRGAHLRLTFMIGSSRLSWR